MCRHALRIGVDPSDGLLCAGEPGTQLTWMDAKHGERVFTPRIGKPVEINALWLNALHVAARLADRVGDTDEKHRCESLLARAALSFRRFWNPELNCLFDVIDVDGDPAPMPRSVPINCLRCRSPTRHWRPMRCERWSTVVRGNC